MKMSIALLSVILSTLLVAVPQSPPTKSTGRKTADSSPLKQGRQGRTSVDKASLCSVGSDRRGGVWLTGSAWSLRGLMINVRDARSNVHLVPSVKSICQCVFVTADVGWMIDSRDLWKTIDSGMSWQRVRIQELPEVSTVHFIDSQNGWVGGWGGEIFRTTDGGQTWRRAEAPLNYEIQQILFVDALQGWAVGYLYPANNKRLRALFRTYDGGAKWRRLSNSNIGLEAGVVSLFFLNPKVGWAIDERQRDIVRTEDGGETWTVKEHGQNYSWNSLFFTDHLNGWAVGYGIAHTADGGVTWKYQLSPNASGDYLKSITFTDAKHGWAVGDDTVIRTDDGGRTWEILPDDWKRNVPDLQTLLNNAVRH